MGTAEVCVKGLFWLALLFFLLNFIFDEKNKPLLKDFYDSLCSVHVK